MPSTAIPTFSQHLADPAFVADPLPVVRAWSELGPVAFNEHHEHYVVFSFEDCARVLGRVQDFNTQINVERFRQLFGDVTMEALDTERHHNVRAIWAQAFSRPSLEEQRALVERVVAAKVDPFVDALRDGEDRDAVSGMVRQIPTLIIAEMLGIDRDAHETFSRWSDAIADITNASMDPTPEGRARLEVGLAASRALNDYISTHLEDHRGDDDDLITTMVRSEFAQDEMTHSEIVANITQLVFAGNETTAKLMASTIVALADSAEQRRLIRENPDLAMRAVEEIHRLHTLTQTVPRQVGDDGAEIAGVALPAGAPIMPMLGLANRDPGRWERPDVLDVTRDRKQHLGFGFGMHVCLGVNLARLEVTVWLQHLLARLPDFTVSGPVDYGRSFGVRGPVSVPMGIA